MRRPCVRACPAPDAQAPPPAAARYAILSPVKRKIQLLVLAAVLAAGWLAPAEDRRPNVIFILADDLGYGDVGFCPLPATNVLARLRTRNLDRLAAGGVVLTGHYAAAPVSAPSRASLMTGRVQGECSLRDNCFDRPFSETCTLASVMKGAGYATWAVGKWGIAGGGESRLPVSSHPLDRGFDYFYGFLDHLAGHTYYHYKGRLNNAWMGVSENRADATDGAAGIYSTDLYIAKAKSLIRRHAAERPGTPFFLYLAVNTVHGSGRNDSTLADSTPLHVPGRPFPAEGLSWPLEPEPRELRNTWIDPEFRGLPPAAARYATAVKRLDDGIGDLLALLDRLGIAQDTMVVFTSDNGPADEYGADPRTFGSAGALDGMKRDVFEGGMRVPAAVRWPARIAPGSRDDAPSQSHDWMATLAEAAGTSAPAQCDGVSLLPRWGASKAPARPSLVYSQYEFPYAGHTAAFREFAARKAPVRGLQQMTRSGRFVALRTRIGEKGGGRVRLYDVVSDPFQRRDLSGLPEYAARVEAMTRILDERLRR